MTAEVELAQRVQALPQELQDLIYDFTFAAWPSATDFHQIRFAWKPPSCLQVNRASRRKFAEVFYGGGAIFVV